MAVRILVALSFTSHSIAKTAQLVSTTLLARFCGDTLHYQSDLVTLAVLCRVHRVRKRLVRTPRALETVIAVAWGYMTADPQDVVDNSDMVAAGAAALRIIHHTAFDVSLFSVLEQRGLVRVLCVLLCGLIRRHVSMRQELQAEEQAAEETGGLEEETQGRRRHSTRSEEETTPVAGETEARQSSHLVPLGDNGVIEDSMDSADSLDLNASFQTDPDISVVMISDDDEDSDEQARLFSPSPSLTDSPLLLRAGIPSYDTGSPIPTRGPDVETPPRRRLSRTGCRPPDSAGSPGRSLEGAVVSPDTVSPQPVF